MFYDLPNPPTQIRRRRNRYGTVAGQKSEAGSRAAEDIRLARQLGQVVQHEEHETKQTWLTLDSGNVCAK